jgi:hypothetical protein
MPNISKNFFSKKKYNITCIAPRKKNISKIFKSIEYIKKIDKNSFKQVSNNLPTILIVPLKGHLNGFYIKDNVWISASEGIDYDHMIYVASLLVHESHHMIQAKENKKYFGVKAEKEAYLKQKNFLLKIPNKKLRNWFVKWLDKQLNKKWWLEYKKYTSKKNPLDFYLGAYKKDELKIKPLRK